jgi:hypothetical protein
LAKEAARTMKYVTRAQVNRFLHSMSMVLCVISALLVAPLPRVAMLILLLAVFCLAAS